jgi:hypothetical protein
LLQLVVAAGLVVFTDQAALVETVLSMPRLLLMAVQVLLVVAQAAAALAALAVEQAALALAAPHAIPLVAVLLDILVMVEMLAHQALALEPLGVV